MSTLPIKLGYNTLRNLYINVYQKSRIEVVPDGFIYFLFLRHEGLRGVREIEDNIKLKLHMESAQPRFPGCVGALEFFGA